ncbi:MAG TPA: dehydrogenase E1 component subunit alpha/beta [Thermoanaerobaculaceae bacterium]|nr:dehydrogenase E1 component subunit alpha/beta [Thermoanaerobaculaceae bacterium]
MATVAKNEAAALPLAEVLGAYRLMLTSRKVDDKEIQLKQQNLAFFQINGVGHEGILAAASRHLSAQKDWFFTYYRDRTLALALGMTPYEAFLGAVGAEEGPDSRGRQMPNHFGQRRLHLAPSSSPTGMQCLQGIGFAEAGRYLLAMEKAAERADAAPDEVVWVSLGDGTTSQGEFWESLNTACNARLPILYVVEDNGYAISVPVDAQTPGGSISKLLTGFPNLAIYEVDGCDFVESYRVTGEAVARVRSGEGPALVHAHVVRPYSHSLSDDERLYKPAAEREREAARDPIRRTARLLTEHYGVLQQDLDRIEAEVQAEVNEAAERAIAAPQPAPTLWAEFIYSAEVDPCSERFASEPAPGDPSPKTMVDLLNSALRDEMARDERIIVFGEDVADASHEEVLSEVKGKGGVFKVTHGLQRLYGSRRVSNSPLAEANIVGRAIGMALRGLKPVAEIQFLDYIWTAFMQIRDELANVRWRSGGSWSAPVVVRVPCGGYLKGGGPYHSQSGEVLFTHIPGLRVVMPSNALDANGLLRTAIRCDDPVVFLEHKHLYRQTHNKAPYPGSEYTVPFGKAAVAREGADLTVVTYGATVVRSLQAAKRLADTGAGDVEVIDLRSLAPYDWEAIAGSVRKTGRALVVYEDTISFGYGAEIAARIGDELFAYLDAPVRRVAAKDAFVGYAPSLEDVTLPQVETIQAGMRDLLAF